MKKDAICPFQALWTSTGCGGSSRCRERSGTARRRSTASRRNRGTRSRKRTRYFQERISMPSSIRFTCFLSVFYVNVIPNNRRWTGTRRRTRSGPWRTRRGWPWRRSPTGSRTEDKGTGRRARLREDQGKQTVDWQPVKEWTYKKLQHISRKNTLELVIFRSRTHDCLRKWAWKFM